MIDEIGIIMDIVIEYGWAVPGRRGGGAGSGVMRHSRGIMFFAYKDPDDKLFISIIEGMLMVRDSYEEPKSFTFRMSLGNPECIDRFRDFLERYGE